MTRFVKQIRDGNHGEIVRPLRARGVEVIETFRPLDLLIFDRRSGRSGWIEIKTESRKTAIQRTQIAFMSDTRMPVAFVKTVDEAVAFSETFEGLTQRQKDNLAVFLRDATKKQYHPAVLERVLGWE